MSASIGRNDPCPCGSGKKLKKCCNLRSSALGNAVVVPQTQSPTDLMRGLGITRRRFFAKATIEMIAAMYFHLDLVDSAPPFMNLHRDNAHDLFAFFENHPIECSVLQAHHQKIEVHLQVPEDAHDPVVTSDAALVFNILLASYPDALHFTTRRHAREMLRQMLQTLVSRTATAAQEQIRCLHQIIGSLANFVESRKPRADRVTLIELPIGNSLPVKLAHDVLIARGLPSSVVRISMARNDTVSAGLTRKQILEKAFKRMNVGPNDLVIYLDEWMTGSNFYSLARYLEKFVRRSGAAFLPVGLLSQHAQNDDRYESQFVPAHERLCAALGVSGERFRQVFPPIKTRHEWTPFFFWAEQDCLAGYRKMQSMGSTFSVLDQTIEKLRASAEALTKSKHAIADHYFLSGESDQKIGPLLVGFIGLGDHYERQFEKGYQEYQRVRPELEARFRLSQYCWGEEDMDESTNEALTIINDLMGQSPAAICVIAARLYFKRELHETFEQYDRFYFRSHAPVIWDLDVTRRTLHEEWMRLLKDGSASSRT